jgi:hypothetical protein
MWVCVCVAQYSDLMTEETLVGHVAMATSGPPVGFCVYKRNPTESEKLSEQIFFYFFTFFFVAEIYQVNGG